MKDCVFCKIIEGKIPSYTIYEDDIVKVFLSIEPISTGHTLIVPKKHYKDFTDIDLDTLTHINEVSKKIYDLLNDKLHFIGLQFIQNNGSFQDIKHYHLHLIPAYTRDEKLSLEKVSQILNN